MNRRVVVTGLGMLTAVGNTVGDSWENLCAGQSGVGLITHFDTEAYAAKFAAMVSGLDVSEYLSPKDARKMDEFIQYGMVAGIQAIRDSGLEVQESNAHRVGVSIGSGIGGLTNIEKNYTALVNSGPRKVSPFFVPGTIINMIAGNLSIMYGMKGPNIAVTTACTTGTHAIGLAAQQIQLGSVDVMVAGGAEKASTPIGMSGFAAARALSTRNDAPTEASRPWDKGRDGFVLGDGAGVVVLEEYEHAKARGAKIYAELVGFGMSGDAFHMTSPPADGAGAALSMKNALDNAGMNADEVDYINAHGTSTPAGDLAEANAVKTVFGHAAENVSVSSTKSMIGHLLGAAGAVEAIIAIKSIQDQIVPPTINLNDPEDDLNLDLVPNVAKERVVTAALSNSFGFGGTNGSLIFKKI